MLTSLGIDSPKSVSRGRGLETPAFEGMEIKKFTRQKEKVEHLIDIIDITLTSGWDSDRRDKGVVEAWR